MPTHPSSHQLDTESPQNVRAMCATPMTCSPSSPSLTGAMKLEGSAHACLAVRLFPLTHSGGESG